MFSGTHLICRRIFDFLPDKDFSGIVDDVYHPLIRQKSDTLAGVGDDGPWFDIGTPSRYLSASESISSMMLGGELEPPTGSRAETSALPSFRTLVESRASWSVLLSEAGASCTRERRCDVRFSGMKFPSAPGAKWTDAIIGNGVEFNPDRRFRMRWSAGGSMCPYADGILLNEQFAFVPIDSSQTFDCRVIRITVYRFTGPRVARFPRLIHGEQTSCLSWN